VVQEAQEFDDEEEGVNADGEAVHAHPKISFNISLEKILYQNNGDIFKPKNLF
jgi:hypothetical protein